MEVWITCLKSQQGSGVPGKQQHLTATCSMEDGGGDTNKQGELSLRLLPTTFLEYHWRWGGGCWGFLTPGTLAAGPWIRGNSNMGVINLVRNHWPYVLFLPLGKDYEHNSGGISDLSLPRALNMACDYIYLINPKSSKWQFSKSKEWR